MKRIVFAIAAMLAISVAAMAVPAQRGNWKTLRLVDGTEVRAEFRGDEFGHFWAAEDGRCFVAAEDGDLYEQVSLDEIADKAAGLRAAMTGVSEVATRSPKRRMTIGGEHEPYVGKKKCLVFLVNYTDTKFEADHDWDYYNRMTNEIGFSDTSGNIASVKDYFLDQSYGQLDIDFDVVGPVELEHGHSYYAESNYIHAHEMVREACAWAYSQGMDFSQYDWDGDGVVEQVYVLYAGHSSTSGQYPDTVWPHMSILSGWEEGALNYDGITIDTYACSNELSNMAVSGRADGIGSMCHEFSHCMGLPDLYDTTYTNYGMDYWDLMASGNYNGDNSGYVPAGYTSYERMYCGWLDPIELSDEEVLVDGMKGLTEGGEAYVIYNKAKRNEYYLLENRTPVGFDAGLPGSGMLILHVDFSLSLWSQNLVNATGYFNDHQRLTVIPCDNNFSTSSMSARAGDAWPYGGSIRLDNYSTPAGTVYTANSDGSYYMNVSITRIAQADDGTISFDFYPAGKNPNQGNPPEGNVFYESFDYCCGTGGNDGLFGSTISTGTFQPDNDGWESANSHGCDECAMFGSNNNAANVVTPSFEIDGETEFIFKAAPYELALSQPSLSGWNVPVEMVDPKRPSFPPVPQQ